MPTNKDPSRGPISGFNPETRKELYVICNKETDVSVDTSIEFRRYYIEGSGQLCNECGPKYP